MEEAKKKILVVDDELDITEVVTRLLEAHNFNVVTVNDAAAGIKASKAEKPDLILMDINMPGKDGFEAATAIKADADTAHIPILMLTVDDSIDNIGKAYNLKIDGYVAKSLISVMLIERIACILDVKEEA